MFYYYTGSYTLKALSLMPLVFAIAVTSPANKRKFAGRQDLGLGVDLELNFDLDSYRRMEMHELSSLAGFDGFHGNLLLERLMLDEMHMEELEEYHLLESYEQEQLLRQILLKRILMQYRNRYNTLPIGGGPGLFRRSNSRPRASRRRTNMRRS